VGLVPLIEHDATEVAVKLDSELVVKQMNGLYKVRNPVLREQKARLAQVAAAFGTVSFILERTKGAARAGCRCFRHRLFHSCSAEGEQRRRRPRQRRHGPRRIICMHHVSRYSVKYGAYEISLNSNISYPQLDAIASSL